MSGSVGGPWRLSVVSPAFIIQCVLFVQVIILGFSGHLLPLLLGGGDDIQGDGTVARAEIDFHVVVDVALALEVDELEGKGAF